MHVIAGAYDDIRLQPVCPLHDMMNEFQWDEETIVQVRQLNDPESRECLWEIGHRDAVDIRQMM